MQLLVLLPRLNVSGSLYYENSMSRFLGNEQFEDHVAVLNCMSAEETFAAPNYPLKQSQVERKL